MRDLEGRTIVVTGATTGIGKESARTFATRGADVLLVARDEARAQATLDEFRRSIPDAQVDWVHCDLGSLASVRRAADAIRSKRERIHVLLNNAGAMHTTRRESEDGFELSFAVNHLAHFLLTNLLREPLAAASTKERRSRVVNVASALYTRGKLDWDDILWTRRPYASFDVYADSKLCNVMFARDLARRWAPLGITSNSLHPGVIGSGFGLNNPGWMTFGLSVVRPFLLTPEKGARTSIALCADAALEGVTGEYFVPVARKAKTSARAADEAAQARLWALSSELTGL